MDLIPDNSYSSFASDLSESNDDFRYDLDYDDDVQRIKENQDLNAGDLIALGTKMVNARSQKLFDYRKSLEEKQPSQGAHQPRLLVKADWHDAVFSLYESKLQHPNYHIIDTPQARFIPIELWCDTFARCNAKYKDSSYKFQFAARAHGCVVNQEYIPFRSFERRGKVDDLIVPPRSILLPPNTNTGHEIHVVVKWSRRECLRVYPRQSLARYYTDAYTITVDYNPQRDRFSIVNRTRLSCPRW